MCFPDSRGRPPMPSKPHCFPTPRPSRGRPRHPESGHARDDHRLCPAPDVPDPSRPRARTRARLRCNNSFRAAHASSCAVRRRHVSHLEGTFWAHLCPPRHSRPLVAVGKNAGRPACFADGPTVDRGAPKGIRIPVAALKGQSPWPLDDGGVCGSWWAVQVSNL